MSRSNLNRIGLGTAAIGRPSYINLKTADDAVPFDKEQFRLNGIARLNAAYDMGIRHFDTASGYGMAEDLLLDWLENKNDDEINISSKWGYQYVANFNPNARVHEIKEHSLTMLLSQWKKTKQLLPYLKVYQIHSATLDTGVLENTAVLNQLHALKVAHGLHIGLSVTGDNQSDVLNEGIKVSINGVQLFESVQFTFNLLEQNMLTHSQQLNNFKGPIFIKEAMANGRIFPNDKYPHYSELYQYLSQLALKYQVGIDAIALQFCQVCFPNAIVLSGANNDSHLASNLKANSFDLDRLEIEKLSSFGVGANAYWNERKKLAWN